MPSIHLHCNEIVLRMKPVYRWTSSGPLLQSFHSLYSSNDISLYAILSMLYLSKILYSDKISIPFTDTGSTFLSSTIIIIVFTCLPFSKYGRIESALHQGYFALHAHIIIIFMIYSDSHVSAHITLSVTARTCCSHGSFIIDGTFGCNLIFHRV